MPTIEEKLKKIEEQKTKLLKQEKELKQRAKEKERRERTRRLVQVGAIFEKYFDITGQEEAEQVAIQFGDMVKAQKRINKDYILLSERNDNEEEGV
ncbi:hypothetical protein ICR95_25725 (plasmid) [Priestia megaterium]|uniref:Relaxasome subunit MobC n=1 Tax=Priestia megaterium TaxID=1404 RepID=A0AAX6BT29_PRIMG|nr:hypothetical protein [Priestia megaterium]QSF35876.1 hypothetical protein ICR95_25725 [Priestia megaterium]GMG76933.1 hypothetical protein ShirakiTB12_54020 [Priestia megaterium]